MDLATVIAVRGKEIQVKLHHLCDFRPFYGFEIYYNTRVK